jgi:hypothetical protein
VICAGVAYPVTAAVLLHRPTVLRRVLWLRSTIIDILIAIDSRRLV